MLTIVASLGVPILQAIEREEALQKAEAVVEEDEKRFDRFLKDNDRKLQEAIKKAELEVRRKQDKVMW